MEKIDNAELLRSRGIRVTKVRSALMDILSKTKLPLSQGDVIRNLAVRGITVNRTTIYRDLCLLVEENIAQEVRFIGRDSKYEISGRHHHHLVCLGCKKISNIAFKKHLESQEKYIKRKENFKVTAHALEFFGLCRNCLNKS